MQSIANSEIAVASCDYIPYSPTYHFSNTSIQYLTHAQFRDRFGCQYTESVLDRFHLAPSLLKEWSSGLLEPSNSLLKKTRKRITNPSKSLVICHMSDEVGYGVFALNFIPAGTVLCFYSGELQRSRNNSDVYSWDCGRNPGQFFIDASAYGGIARFIQHLPNDPVSMREHVRQEKSNRFPPALKALMTEEIKKALDEDAAKDEAVSTNYQEIRSITWLIEDVFKIVATANVIAKQKVVDGKPLITFVTTRNVLKGEQLGFSYSDGYWAAAKRHPRYFFKNGNVVPFSTYKANTIELAFRNTQTKELEFYDRFCISKATTIQNVLQHFKNVDPYKVRKRVGFTNSLISSRINKQKPTSFQLHLHNILISSGLSVFLTTYLNDDDSATLVCKVKKDGHQGSAEEAFMEMSRLIKHLPHQKIENPELRQIEIFGTNLSTTPLHSYFPF